MKRMVYVVLFIGSLSLASRAYDSYCARIVTDITDTVATGMPVAVFAAVWWAVANRVPRSWVDLSEPASGFIRTTWKEQGYKDADKVFLKEIPRDSIFGKIIMYTQELPQALAVGIPFRILIENLLAQKKTLTDKLAVAVELESKIELQAMLEEVEKKLNECRFVCGHERVHKENHHTFNMLIIQFIAPFVVYSVLKHTTRALDAYGVCPKVSYVLKKSVTRSVFEMLIFWCSAHWYEREADLYASNDPEVVKAGISLFERARDNKTRGMSLTSLQRTLLVWLLKYTHPTSSERIAYLKKALVSLPTT